MRLHSNYTDAEMATGAGFIYELKQVYELITNGHNFTRVNPVTGQNMMNGNPAYPASVSTLFRKVIIQGGQQKLSRVFSNYNYISDDE
ncbi:hypothetical protein LX64_05050 [Chitinophaga skermanii]|uniref:Uncharacterized protein n=1 Tax=Chitinophaga skermanii TaxID=331697 RepID=A0A327Q2W7_9BACT|nr:hypothetical protein LX64_05050 [Chitinophaga skermanii]